MEQQRHPAIRAKVEISTKGTKIHEGFFLVPLGVLGGLYDEALRLQVAISAKVDVSTKDTKIQEGFLGRP